MSAQPDTAVSLEALCQVCNITDRRVQQLAKEGVMRRADERGKYLLIQSVNGYVKSLQDQIRDRESAISSGSNYESEKVRKVRLEADKLHDEKQLRIGNTAPIADFEPEWERVLIQIRTLMQSTVEDVKKLSPGMTAAQEEKIDKALIDGFNRIANIE